MSRKRKQDFQFGLGNIIRIALFLVLCYFIIVSINPTASQQLNITSLPTITLPTDIPSAVNQITTSVVGFVQQVPKFVDQAIRQLKKELVTNLYQDIIKNIDKK